MKMIETVSTQNVICNVKKYFNVDVFFEGRYELCCLRYLIQIAHYFEKLFYKKILFANLASMWQLYSVWQAINNVYITVAANKKSLLFLFTSVVNSRSMVSTTGRNVIV